MRNESAPITHSFPQKKATMDEDIKHKNMNFLLWIFKGILIICFHWNSTKACCNSIEKMDSYRGNL